MKHSGQEEASDPGAGAVGGRTSNAGANADPRTVEGFGEEWSAYTQTKLAPEEQRRMFGLYFALLPFDQLPDGAEGFDLGCGSGRWAELVRERVGFLHCIDASKKALDVARARLGAHPNVDFHLASVDEMPLADNSQDFGYSLGVLHHIPDPAAGLSACVRKLKPGAPFLLYVYYAFDNRRPWFRRLWSVSDVLRQGISRLPFGARKIVSNVMAAAVYWPLARVAKLAASVGLSVDAFPLSAYRQSSFYTMRTDSLDRFGTRLEHRFARTEIEEMMLGAGLENIRFQDSIPYWVALGYRRSDA
jgi:ubiquinone/menaquinone biosynthesis C-methylase UbiE